MKDNFTFHTGIWITLELGSGGHSGLIFIKIDNVENISKFEEEISKHKLGQLST